MGTRERLLDSAEAVARRRGYDGFSYADLAREVGIRKASIHHHFPTKADLALAVMERYRERFFDGLADLSKTHAKAGARLAAYLELYRAAASDGETLCLCVALSISPDSLDAPVLAELDRFHHGSQAWLVEVFVLGRYDTSITDVGEPKDEAAACLALVEGAQLVARSSNDLTKFDNAVNKLRQRLTPARGR